jgi:hypothetical protein
VLVQTAVVFDPVKAVTVIVLIKQDKLAVVGVTVYAGALLNERMDMVVVLRQPNASITCTV